MALVLNALAQEQDIRIHGSWFSFKPKQIKEMHEDKVFFLVSQRRDQGFVALPDEMADLDFRNSKEGKEILSTAEAKGVNQRCEFLEMLRKNEIVSLQRDIDRRGDKYDARLEMSKEMIKNLEELASYQVKKQDEVLAQVAKIKEIEALLGK